MPPGNERRTKILVREARVTAGCLLGPTRFLRLPVTGERERGEKEIEREKKEESKEPRERGETSRTIISDRGSRGRLGPSRYPRHGAQRDVIARVESAAKR